MMPPILLLPWAKAQVALPLGRPCGYGDVGRVSDMGMGNVIPGIPVPVAILIALAGLSPYWESLNPRPSFVTEGREITLSDRLVFLCDMRSADIVGVSSGTGTASSSSLDFIYEAS